MATFRAQFAETDSNMRVAFGYHVETVTSDYEKLNNLPSINTETLIGDKTGDDLHLQNKMDSITNLEINSLFT